MANCTNCQTALSETARFCQHCGQSTRSFREPFVSFFKESLHELLDIDGRLAMTLKTLLLKPGLASYEYEQGKRNKYTPPLRLYLVFSLLFFLVFATFQHMYNDAETGTSSATEVYSRIMFVLFPIFALYTGCLFRPSYFITNLVFSMHLHTVSYIVLLIIGSLEAIEDWHVTFMLLQTIPSLYLLWYVFMAFKTMYRESWLLTVVKALIVHPVQIILLGYR